MRIQIAGISCEFIISDPDFAAELESRYDAFLTSAEPQLELSVQIEQEMARVVKQALKDTCDLSNSMVAITKEHETYMISRFDNPFNATIDFSTSKGKVTMSSSLYCFDSFLRIIYSVLLARVNGALLHAAGIKRGRLGYIFIGVSGSGKTTISGLAKDIVLSDELIAIRKLNGEFVVFSTPFWGEFVSGKVKAEAMLEEAYILVKDTENFLKPLKRFSAAQEILGCTFFFGPENFTGSVFDLCLDLTSEVEIKELHFRPTDEIFSLIEKGNELNVV